MRPLVGLFGGSSLLVAAVFACAPDAVLDEQPAAGAGGDGGQGGAVGGDGGAPRQPCPEIVSTVPTGECDLFLQDCPPPQACVVMFDGVSYFRGCTDELSGKGVMEQCADSNECAPPLRCALHRCAPPCCSANDEPCG